MQKYTKGFFLNEDLRQDYISIVYILRNHIVNCSPCYVLNLYLIIFNMRLERLQKSTNFNVRDYQRNLNLLVKTLKIDVKTNVETLFNITTITESTNNFVADAGGKTRSSICLKMKQDMYVRKVIVLTVPEEFIIFSLRLQDCLINYSSNDIL